MLRSGTVFTAIIGHGIATRLTRPEPALRSDEIARPGPSLTVDNGTWRGNSVIAFCRKGGPSGEGPRWGEEALQSRQNEPLRVGPPGSHRCEVGGALWGCGDRRRLSSVAAAADYVRAFSTEEGPAFIVRYLGSGFELIAIERLGQADAGQKPRQADALIGQGHELGAVGFILAHHDPERTTGSSAEEYEMARQWRRLGEDFGIYLFHHLIIGRDRLREVSA